MRPIDAAGTKPTLSQEPSIITYKCPLGDLLPVKLPNMYYMDELVTPSNFICGSCNVPSGSIIKVRLPPALRIKRPSGRTDPRQLIATNPVSSHSDAASKNY